MSDFKMIQAGWYEWNIGYGYKAIAQKVTNGWHGFVSGPLGAKTLENGQHYLEATTLRAVQASLRTAASKVTVKQTNLMSKVEFDMPITTPWCANPASETYWSM